MDLISQSPFPLCRGEYRAISGYPADFCRAWFAEHAIPIPAEIAQSVRSRQREFFFGRYCARIACCALSPELDAKKLIIGSRPDRRPLFPPGISGSITHCDQFAAAFCFPAAKGNPGLDAERVLDSATAVELQNLLIYPSECGNALWPEFFGAEERLTLIFSAKEAIFKAIYPEILHIPDFMSSRLVGVNPFGNKIAGSALRRTGIMGFQLVADLGPSWPKGRAIDVLFHLHAGLVQTLACSTGIRQFS